MAMRSQAADSVKLELVEDSRDEVEGWGIQNNQWDGFCYLDWLVLDCPFFWIFSLLMWSGRPYCFSNSAAAIATTPTDPARASCRHPHFGHIIASLFLLLFFLDLRSFQMFPTVYPKVPVYMFLSVFFDTCVPSSGLGFPGIYVQQGLDSEPKTPASSPPSSTSSTAATMGDKEDRKFVSRVRFEVRCAISMLMLMLSIMAISRGVANPCCLVSCDVWFFQSVDSKIHAQSFLVSRTGRIRWRWMMLWIRRMGRIWMISPWPSGSQSVDDWCMLRSNLNETFLRNGTWGYDLSHVYSSGRWESDVCWPFKLWEQPFSMSGKDRKPCGTLPP